MMRNPGFDVRHYFLRKQILAKQCRLNAAFIRYLIRKVLFMGSPVIRAHCTSCIAAAICAFWLTSACCQEAAKQPKLNSEVERCRRIINEHMQTHCLEQINAKAAPVPQQQPAASGPWQLARTPNASGGPDTISITKITNPNPSAQDVTNSAHVLISTAASVPQHCRYSCQC